MHLSVIKAADDACNGDELQLGIDNDENKQLGYIEVE